MISQWTVVSVFNKIFNFFVSHLFVIYFLSFQLFVFSALWSSQPFELPSFLVSKLFGPPKMSLVLRPPVAWSLNLRTGPSTNSCRLCLMEKFTSSPELATINQRDEFFTPCLHKEAKLLDNAVTKLPFWYRTVDLTKPCVYVCIL